MQKHAGSAITQHVGKMDSFHTWYPTKAKTKWLLLSGASDPPKNIDVSTRRPRENPETKGGAFLHGATVDIASMTKAVNSTPDLELFNQVTNIRSTKEQALEHIKDLYNACEKEGKKPVIYYTGHGEVGTGNWCFSDGAISIEDLEGLSNKFWPLIISDCCFSGNWADHCLNKGISKYQCLAACPYFTDAFDIGSKGGELTLYMTNQHESHEMERVPVYSEHDDESHPFDKTIDSKIGFFDANLKNSDKRLICHTVGNNKISALFVKTDTRIPSKWSYSRSYEDFLKTLNKNWEDGMRCKSISSDENGILMYCEKGYGTEQRCFCSNEEIIKAEIAVSFQDGMRITGCCSYNSLWLIIMTTFPSSNFGYYDIQENFEGFIRRIKIGESALISACYNIERNEYFIKMERERKKKIVKEWFNDREINNLRHWLKARHNENYRVNFMFKDPDTNRTLIQMEEADSVPEFDIAFDFFIIND